MIDESQKNQQIMALLSQAKKIAGQYQSLTGKPLGITGEIAEYEAARILGLKLAEARQAGFDAIEYRKKEAVKLQIKGRCIHNIKKTTQRMGSIDLSKPFDAVLLVLMDANYDVLAIYECSREKVIEALMSPGSKARNERSMLGIKKFISMSIIRWERPALPGGIDVDEVISSDLSILD